MINNKTLTFFIILIILFDCCKQGNCKDKLNISAKETKAQKHSEKKKVLVPYSDVYKYDSPTDTTLPNGTFISNLVNRDTSDRTLYIKYGNKRFDSLFPVPHGVEQSPCHNYEVCYVTENTLAIIYQCMNSRALTVLPLDNTKPVIERLNPIYIGSKQGFTISLMDGDDREENGDSLLVADFDFIEKQYIKISGLTCPERSQCIDDIKVKGNKLHLKYTGAIPNADPQIISQVVKIKIK